MTRLTPASPKLAPSSGTDLKDQASLNGGAGKNGKIAPNRRGPEVRRPKRHARSKTGSGFEGTMAGLKRHLSRANLNSIITINANSRARCTAKTPKKPSAKGKAANTFRAKRTNSDRPKSAAAVFDRRAA